MEQFKLEVDFDEPVDQDGPHFVVDFSLSGHVAGTGVDHFLILKQVLEDLLRKFSTVLGISCCVLLTILRIFIKYRTLEVLIAGLEGDMLPRLSLLEASSVCSVYAAHTVEAFLLDSQLLDGFEGFSVGSNVINFHLVLFLTRLGI